MRTTKQNENENNTTTTNSFAKACVACCQKIMAQIQKAKLVILKEFREVRGAHEHLLRLAVNEAEALAWQTDFPHLFFPALAMEKAQAVANWGAHQRAIRQLESAHAFAA